MADDARELRGIGGWLAFFIVVLTVFAPIRAVVNTATNLYGDPGIASAYADRWVLLQAIEWGIVAVAIGTYWYLGWRLYAVHVWQSVQLTIAGLWLVPLLMSLIEVIVVGVAAGIDVDGLRDLVGSVLPELWRPALSAGVWTAYLLRSRRVANTYARHPDDDELNAVFD